MEAFRKYLIFTTILALAVALANCGGDNTNGGGGGGEGDDDDDYTVERGPNEECLYASHCAAEKGAPGSESEWKCNYTDTENKVSKCVCLSNDACSGNKLCNRFTGECYEKSTKVCKSDAACGTTEYCDLDVFECTPRGKLCEECKAENECLGGRCGTSYEVNTEIKHCSKECKKDEDCNEEGGNRFACVNSLCAPARANCCASDFDCQAGQRCNKEHYVCEAYCDNDSDCPSAQKCCDNVCVRELYCDSGCSCRTWSDGSMLVCNLIKNECMIPCTGVAPDEENQCPPGTAMSGTKPIITPAGKCLPPECPLGSVCKPETGSCLASCTKNSDCTINQNCEGGVCVDGRCQTSDVCNYMQFCSGGKCTTPSNNYCKKGCTPGMACEGSSSNFCLSLDGTLTGPSYCGINCETGGKPDDSKCPKGFFCVTLVTGTGSVAGYACYPAAGNCP